MNRRQKRNSAIAVILCLPIFAGDIALVARGRLPLFQALIPCVFTLAILFGLWFFLRRRDGQKIEGDERSMRIEGRAFCYSWMLTLYALFLLILNGQLGLVSLSTEQCLFLALAVMLVTNLAFRAALNRKGDLEE